MLIAYFIEAQNAAYPEAERHRLLPDDHPARSAGENVLLFSNRFFDPQAASRLLNNYLEQYRYAEEAGFDAIVTNEHHNGPFCMHAHTNISAAMIAGVTERVKLLTLGNLLPTWEHPLGLAEELAMLDLYSQGRLIAGIVRGGGQESIATNTNPAYNRERFDEAHELLIDTWTRPGPFRWEGEHYQYRVVNPWVLPLQQPHPRIFVPGITSRETIRFAARHGYPYIAQNTTREDTEKIWGLYDEIASESGFTPGPEHRGYVLRVHVAETREKAIEGAREFLWMDGHTTGIGKPEWVMPSGHSTYEARTARMRAAKIVGADLETQLEAGTIVAGTPDEVADRICTWLEHTKPSILSLFCNDGRISQEDAMTNIRLLGEEVIPKIRQRGDELGLVDPFTANSPVSLAAASSQAAPAGV